MAIQVLERRTRRRVGTPNWITIWACHPALNTFLDWLQHVHHSGQVKDLFLHSEQLRIYLVHFQLRTRQLLNGELPHRRKVRWILLDKKLNKARQQLLTDREQSLRVILNGRINPVLKNYLTHVGFLLGGMNDKTAEKKKNEAAEKKKNEAAEKKKNAAKAKKKCLASYLL